MTFLRKFRLFSFACCVLLASAVLAALGTGLLLSPKADAQNAGQVLLTMTGQELIQLDVPGTAAITYTSTSSMRDGRFYLYQVPLTGFTITMTTLQSAVSINPAGTLAAGTITLPPTTTDGKLVTIYSSQIITALTINTSNSATFAPAVVTTLAADASVGYVYDKANNQWHRIQ